MLSLRVALGNPCHVWVVPSPLSIAQLLSWGIPNPEASQRAWLTYWKKGSAGPSTVMGPGGMERSWGP